MKLELELYFMPSRDLFVILHNGELVQTFDYYDKYSIIGDGLMKLIEKNTDYLEYDRENKVLRAYKRSKDDILGSITLWTKDVENFDV